MFTAFTVAPDPFGPLDPDQVIQYFPNLAKIAFATSLGMLLGVEREWSRKPAGIRTFTLITIGATILTLVTQPFVVVLCGALIVFQGALLGVRGLFSDDENDFMTTSMTMVVAYGIGILIGKGMYFEGIVTGLLVSFLLILGRELHSFAWNRSRDEIRSSIEFGIISFVVYPLLPDSTFGPWNSINPRTIWMLVVAVSAIGFVNYLLVKRYGTKGIAITSFFGGLVNSTAVIGEMVSRIRENSTFTSVGVGAILLADAAMAFRDLIIAVLFMPQLVFTVGLPLGAITATGVVLSYVMSDWNTNVEIEFASPFKLQNAIRFGGLFLIVLLLSAGSQQFFGSSGFLISSFLSGLLSSGAVTTTAVLLLGNGQITREVATVGIITGVTASILVKLALVTSMDRSLVRPVTIGSLALILASLVGSFTTILTLL